MVRPLRCRRRQRFVLFTSWLLLDVVAFPDPKHHWWRWWCCSWISPSPNLDVLVQTIRLPRESATIVAFHPPTAALKFRGGRLLLSTFSIHGYGDIDGTRGGRMSGYSDDFSTRLYRIFIVYIYRLYRPPIMGTIAVLLFLPLLYIVLCFYFATPILGSYALQFSRGMWYHSNNGSSFCLLESDFLFCPLSTGDADWRATSWYFEYLLW